MSGATLSLTIRPFALEDEPEVLALLNDSLGGGPAGPIESDFFRWKHLANPFGPSFMLVAEAEGAIVGFRSFLRWQLRVDGREVLAVRAVDTATHPEFQGRGVFSRLTRAALEMMRGEVDLVFNTPNGKSLPGYLKLGWTSVGKQVVHIRVRRPLAFLARARATGDGVAPRPGSHVPTAAEVLADEQRVARLIDVMEVPEGRFATPKDVPYLRWRYAAARGLRYYALPAHEGGELRGLAIVRVRARGRLTEATTCELLVAAEHERTARRLLGEVASSFPVDHVACRFPSGGAGPSPWRSRFLRAPGGIDFVVNPLGRRIEPDPADLGSWALSIGDLELF